MRALPPERQRRASGNRAKPSGSGTAGSATARPGRPDRAGVRPARERRARGRRSRLMTKSFLISLAGFAIGLGVTTALTFITPGLDTGEGPSLADVPIVEQQIALLPKRPPPKRPPAKKSARQRDKAASNLPPAPPLPALPQSAAPITADPSAVKRPAGPAMPAVKQSEIKTARLKKPVVAAPPAVLPSPPHT